MKKKRISIESAKAARGAKKFVRSVASIRLKKPASARSSFNAAMRSR